MDAILPLDSHHAAHLLKIASARPPLNVCKVRKRNFYAADYGAINRSLSLVNWNAVLDGDNIDSVVDSFYNVVNNIIVSQVPFTGRRSDTYPSWYDAELISAICNKERVHSLWKESRDSSLEIEFKRLRAICVRLSRSKYRAFIEATEAKIKYNIRAFWSYVKGLRSESGLPSYIYFGSSFAYDDMSISNAFSSHFSSVYSRDSVAVVDRCDDLEPVPSCLATPLKVRSIVNGLKDNANPGPDGIAAHFVRCCWSVLEKPIVELFNRILSAGVFPSRIKLSYILPV